MREVARVLTIEGSTATLSCEESQGCANCSGTFCNVKARTYEATVPDNISAFPGDTVEVFIPPSRAIAAGFWVLIAPLILFVAGYFALSALDSEPLQVAGGVAGLAIGFLLVALRSRKRTPELPKIVALHSVPDHS